MADVEAKTCALVKIVEFHETLEDVFLLVEGNADTGVCDWERNRFCILVCLGTDGYAAFLGIFYGVGKEVYQYLADTPRITMLWFIILKVVLFGGFTYDLGRS